MNNITLFFTICGVISIAFAIGIHLSNRRERKRLELLGDKTE